MKAQGRLSEQIETLENFEEGEDCASRRKRRRKEVRDFRAHRAENLSHLLAQYRDITLYIQNHLRAQGAIPIYAPLS